MNKVKIKMEHCFGIKKLSHEFDFSDKNVFTIYAINGTMKSSFAKAFKCFQCNKKEDIKDKIYNISGTFDLKFDEIDAHPEEIFVINSLDAEYEADITNLLIDKSISKKLKTIYSIKNKIFDKLIKISDYKFEANSKKEEKYLKLEEILLKDLKSTKDSFITSIESFCREIPIENYEFVKYSLIFDKTILEKIQTPAFQTKISDYLKMTDKIYSEYLFLQKGALTLPKLKDVSKLLSNTDFFKCNNQLFLNGLQQHISSSIELNNRINEIETRLKESSEFQEIEKVLSSVKGKELKDIIELNPEIIKWLKIEKLDELKRILWLSYFQSKEIHLDLENLHKEYQNIKKQIEALEVNNTEWEQILNIYSERFSVPYKMQVTNLRNAILGVSIPQIEFNFKDGEQEKSFKRNELTQLDTLSQGEKRALYLLNIIFDIEQIKKQERDTLIIIDDIADSFDYKNKYAIIEYLCELANNPKFKLIILSHNFDFYRTISSRLGLKKLNRFIALSNRGSIDLAKPSCDNNPFENWIQNPTEITFLALIPFVRNLIEYRKDKKHVDYIKLTELLHQKEETINLKFKDIISIYQEYINPKYISSNLKMDTNIFNRLLCLCDEIKNNNKRLEHKLILAMGIRHRAEYFMISTLNNLIGKDYLEEKLKTCDSNQTRYLFNLFCSEAKNNHTLVKYKDVLEKVNIVTPENIHINAFMYEPIMDMDITELLNLYKKVSELTKGIEYGKDENGN